jgi:hypothetical protein
MTTTPRPLQRPSIRRSLEAAEKKQKDILTLTGAFDKHLKEAWDFTSMGQKELLVLHDLAGKHSRTGESYLLIHIKK